MSEGSYRYTDRQRPLQDCHSDNDRVMAESGKERDMSIYPSGASTPQSEYNPPPFRSVLHVFAWLLGLSCVNTTDALASGSAPEYIGRSSER